MHIGGYILNKKVYGGLPMDKTIVISPYSRPLRNGANNPKNYPFWQELIDKLVEKQYEVIQIGVKGEVVFNNVTPKFNLPLIKIKQLIEECHIFISVDNFLPHLSQHCDKPGIVLWGRSNPKIFGYQQNINLLKDEKYLRPDQYNIWEAIIYDPDVFVKPEMVLQYVK
jgi:ADP-heptose:LPS heptosyltransferase